MGQRRNLKCDAPSGLATDCGRITLVLFRTRRRDECLELKEGLGRRVRKSRQKEAAGVCGGRGVIYGISIDFRPESLARSGIRQKGSY